MLPFLKIKLTAIPITIGIAVKPETLNLKQKILFDFHNFAK
ncbi:hypothetical protein NU08_1956 [Flavobacterium anhuiense]|uniref:Uncharacterized protein n=1 Tax=Flavobacterium anhuiense TaxID=459526 RepID=A0A444W099_9FLAO|nr:hypothetical protein NU08_1956 [Flavobacterium anhuiense]